MFAFTIKVGNGRLSFRLSKGALVLATLVALGAEFAIVMIAVALNM